MNDAKNNYNKKNINDKQMKKIAKNLDKSIKNYRRILMFASSDAPISLLCLPKIIETILTNHGCLRIYDLFDRDLGEIKGLGETRLRHLTTRLNEFIAMS